MPCDNCGGAVRIQESSGATTGEGSFFELYECVNCGATGTIHGQAEDTPTRWDRSGQVFSGSPY